MPTPNTRIHRNNQTEKYPYNELGGHKEITLRYGIISLHSRIASDYRDGIGTVTEKLAYVRRTGKEAEIDRILKIRVLKSIITEIGLEMRLDNRFLNHRYYRWHSSPHRDGVLQ